ncbi:MAG: waaF [Paucimonas sp.]|nr:waaF [Paucimonas sp.]
MKPGPGRTLVISPNWIGDAVMAQPLLQRLRARDPERAIDVLAPAWVAPIWRAMQEVDTVIESPFRHGQLQLKERWRFARALKRRGYAEAYVLPNTLKFALIPLMAGIRRRIGYVGESRYGFINILHRDNRKSPRPMVSFYAALADAPAADALPPSALPKPRLAVSDEVIAAVLSKAGLAQDARLVAFAPGAEFGSAKRWPAGHFAALALYIRAADPEAQVVLLGSGKDSEVTAAIQDQAPFVRDLAGRTSLGEAVALLARADAVVSNDSGLLHIASALNRPVVALYGPTDPGHAPPFSDIAHSLSLHLDCSPCRQRECPLGHHACMNTMEPGMVWEPVRGILEK